jgi:hypothetical protein
MSPLAVRLAVEILARAFPGVATAELARAHADAGGRVADASALIQARLSISPLPGALRAGATRAAAPARLSSATACTPAGAAIARAIAASLERVGTGEAMASLYLSARGEAAALARARNDAFDRASRAFLSKDAAAAGRFSAQGRSLDARMHAAQAEAAARIYASRNAAGRDAVQLDVGRGVQVDVRSLDLHGLHPQEASALVGAALSGGAAGRADAVWLACITGARSHSAALGKGGGSVHAAVVRAAQEAGFAVYEPSAGVAVVKVLPSA